VSEREREGKAWGARFGRSVKMRTVIGEVGARGRGSGDRLRTVGEDESRCSHRMTQNLSPMGSARPKAHVCEVSNWDWTRPGTPLPSGGKRRRNSHFARPSNALCPILISATRTHISRPHTPTH